MSLPESAPSKPSPKERRPDNGRSLRLRLLISVGLALLPPSVLIVAQGIQSAQHDTVEERDQLVATARTATMPTENVLASADQIALALSNVPEIRQPSAGCNAALTGAMHSLTAITNISRTNAAGTVICSALPGAIGRNSSHHPLWNAARTGSKFVVSGITQSTLLQRPVIYGELPLHDSAGHFDGMINIVIDLRWLDRMLAASPLPASSVVAIFDRDRRMIAADNSTLADDIFSHAVFEDGDKTNVHSTLDSKRQVWTYAIAPLLGQDVYVGFARPASALFHRTYLRVAVDVILPFLMIVLTWLTIWVVTERQLTRWILYLCRISESYRGGHYALRPVLASAPSELQMLGDSMAQMAASIQDRDRSLRDAVAQKTLLIKEIHHRVKNNLQIVMSLLSLQAGRSTDPKAQETLRHTRARINALALVHRILYEIDDQRIVQVKPLLEQLAEQTSEGFIGDRRDVHVEVDCLACEVPSEMAVPLALLTVEALTNAFKHAFPAGRRGMVRVVLARSDTSMLRLAIEDNGVGFDCNDAESNIGARLLRTLGQQLGGATTTRSNANSGTTVETIFPAPAEARRQYE